MSERAIKTINVNLNGHGAAVVKAAKAAGFDMIPNEEGRLDLADACALVDHESIGGQNIFGADFGTDVGDEPPYAHHPVTCERVQALRDGGEYPHGMNGIGLTQLTWWEYVEEAERRGGAHLPEHQCSVGFEVLRDHVGALGYALGIGAYNAGPGNAQLGIDNGYYGKVMEKREKWVKLLAGMEEEVAEYPTAWMKGPGWQTDDKGRYARVRARTKVLVSPDGWQYAMPIGPEPAVVPGGSWLERHPTRYTWRQDVEELILRILVKFPGVTITTYVDHPEGYGLDTLSFDVWGEKGRGDPIGSARGQQVFDFVFKSSPLPINWTIWNGWIWVRGEGWSRYGGENDDPITDAKHTKHPHFTMV